MRTIFFNKQRALFIAMAIALVLFFVLGGLLWLQTQRTDATMALRDEHHRLQRIATWHPALSKEPLPVVKPIPLRKKDATDLILNEAHAGVIVDVGSGDVLFAKNATQKRGIASTTKLLTAIIVVDRVRNLDEYVRVPPGGIKIEGTKVGCITSTHCAGTQLTPGEELRVRDLLAAMLMDSANDAATLLALHIAGSEENFARLMNLRAQEIGLRDSHFCRPSGLEVDPPRQEDECYSTAYDIARVMAHIVDKQQYAVLLKIMQTKEKTITAKDGIITHELSSTNRLLGEVPYFLAVKTGFTPRAGFSLVAAAQKPGTEHKIVIAVLDDKERFNDITRMAQWAFTNFVWQ